MRELSNIGFSTIVLALGFLGQPSWSHDNDYYVEIREEAPKAKSDFTSEKLSLELMAELPAVTGDLGLQLESLKAPTKLRINSLQLLNTLTTRMLLVDVGQIEGNFRTDRQAAIYPTLERRQDARGEYVKVTANLHPRMLGMTASMIDDDVDATEGYYAKLEFRSDTTLSYVDDLSLTLVHQYTNDPNHIATQDAPLVKYNVRKLQGEFDFPDLVDLPRVINSDAALGSREITLQLRFALEASQPNLVEALELGLPKKLSLPSVKVAAGILSSHVQIPVTVTEGKNSGDKNVIIAGTSLFEIDASNHKYPLVFRRDLGAVFERETGRVGNGIEKYTLTLEFRTDEVVSQIVGVKLLLSGYSRRGNRPLDEYGDAKDALVKRTLAEYVIDEVQYQLPIYPGDER